jgi:hypothetical protein
MAMGTLRQPDWTDAMGTGLWGLGYRLRENCGLVLLAGGRTIPDADPDRLWPFILTKGHQRNGVAEQAIASQEDFTPFLEHQTVGKEDILCVREKHLSELLSLLDAVQLPLANAEY